MWGTAAVVTLEAPVVREEPAVAAIVVRRRDLQQARWGRRVEVLLPE